MLGNIAFTRSVRAYERLTVNIAGRLRREGPPPPSTVRIRNLSTGGFFLDGGGDLVTDERIQIGLAGLGLVGARVTRVSPSGCACSFDVGLRPDQLSAALAGDNVIIVDFGGSREPAVIVADQPDVGHDADHYPGWIRLLILSVGVAVSWGVVAALITVLHR